MTLVLYNTLNGKKEAFEPLAPNRVTMYVCGPTVYNLAHIGNARPAVVFDTLFRLLQTRYDEVIYARNITDIDDKIIAACRESGRDMAAFTEEFTEKYREDMAGLNVLPPTLEPRATDHLRQMIELTETLIAKGHAYESAGHVLFAVQSMEDYGKLSHRSLEDMLAGARVEVADYKRYPGDFVLWKPSGEDEPGWDSPWGRGRPGWHLECSAMTHAHLGETVDIHGGGRDLIFPHHENEIAQSEAATGTPMANFWVHNGFVQVDSEKMSKSLGNFKTIRDILEDFHPEVLRWFLLTKHYRSPIDFTADAVLDAEKNVKRMYETKRLLAETIAGKKWSGAKLPDEIKDELAELEKHFAESMNDDLNTAAALGHVFGMIKLAGRVMEDKGMRKSAEAKELFERILKDMEGLGATLGLLTRPAEELLEELKKVKLKRYKIDTSEVEGLMAERLEARKAKDFAKSDEIRDALAAMKIEVRDTPQGAVWDVV
jgi:cysteinyl-tRNA synthetase